MHQDSELARHVIDLAIKVHTTLGPGLPADVYEFALCHELDAAGLPYKRQVELHLNYRGTELDMPYRADIIVQDEVLLEIKAVEQIEPIHETELFTYLKMSGCKVGFLLNFFTISLMDGIRRRVP